MKMSATPASRTVVFADDPKQPWTVIQSQRGSFDVRTGERVFIDAVIRDNGAIFFYAKKKGHLQMMGTKLHWVEGPWPGKLALAARPRGGEWLADEITSWHNAGVDTAFSLLTAEEEADLDIAGEAAQAKVHGMKFLSFPILDRQVPESEGKFTQALEKLEAELALGRNVVLHCRQGIGRAGLVAACLLLTKGLDPEAAVKRVSAARGIPVPETPEQRRWIDHYARTFAGIR